MSRSSAGPIPSSTGTNTRTGALSRAAQPAPPGAMRSGAFQDDVEDHSDEDERGRSHSRKAVNSNLHDDERNNSLGPLPAARRDSPQASTSGSSRDGLAKRLSAGLSQVLRGRSASRERNSLTRQDTDASTILNETERGRRDTQGPVSTGRGGVGNVLRSPSRGRPAEEEGETAAQKAYAEKQTVVHSGRGGAGNVRSPSRGPIERARAAELQLQEREIQAAAASARKDESSPQITGRGGAGNIRREHSTDARGRDANNNTSSAGAGAGAGGIGSALRSMSRSRSREPRSRSAHREPPPQQHSEQQQSSQQQQQQQQSSTLAAVDEKSSISASSTDTAVANGQHQHHQGIFGKIASHLPGHHHS
ncbi:unnamed protein product [Sympodiomycopsis kandeliae]